MNITRTLLSLLLLIGAGTSLCAQTAVIVGSQVTSESQIVSGKAYVLKTGADRYITDNGTNYDVPNSANIATEASVYHLISNGDGSWQIRNLNTGHYWGVPVYNSTLASVDNSSSAGAWSLNFSSGIAYPSAPDANNIIRGIDRSNQKVWGYTTGTNDNHKVYIYETPVLTPPTSLTSGWYHIRWQTLDGQTGTGYANNSDVSGKYVRNYATDATVSSSAYPLYLADAPTSINECAASLVYVDVKETVSQNGRDLSGVHCSLRSANGHYIATNGTASTTATDNYCILVSSSTPNIATITSNYSGTRYSLVPMGGDATPYIGQTAQNKFPQVNMYAANPAYLGLEAWTVVYQGEGQVTCSNANLQGLNKVYNGGTFFFTTGTTPVATDFTAETTGLATKIDATGKRITIAPSATLTTSDLAIIQGNESTGKGNTQQALLRLKLTPSAAELTPTALSITLTGADQLSNVAVYTTTIDQLHAAAASPVKVSDNVAPAASLDIPLTMSQLAAGESIYLWVTADVKSNATELGSIDAAITGITYDNWAGTSHTLELTSVGNPDGQMRIYKQQTALWTPDYANTKYYRIPTMLNTADGGIVALTDYRHDHPYDLGKNASNGVGAHVVDVVARRSTDGGLTWQDEVVVAAGDGTNAATYGFGDPAIVRDADGTLHCLMAAGNASYASGMLHVGYSKSTDNGATWSAVEDIYGDIDKGGLTITSAFVTGGKGVTFGNGRMAFAFLGKVSGTTNIYPIYSDDKGATWYIQPTVAYGGGDESKLEIMNDGSLLLSVRKGSYNGTAVRSYNRTTGDASADGIASWGTAANWGSEMNANGCNADILYYNRSTEDASRPDVIFHTLTKAYNTFRKDLRLYMSFDQGATWQEAFQLQPGYAAYSSMQKLANGDLAIIYEDGSIGNKDKQDCYAINYVVISSETINEKIDELYGAAYDTPEKEVKVVYGTTAESSFGSISDGTWTSNADSGLAGLKLTKSDGAFDKFSNWNGHYNLAYKPATANTASTLTLSAPEGYVIKSYSLLAAKAYSAAHTYTLTAADGTTITPAFANSSTGYTTLSVTNVNAQSTAISVTTTDASKYLAIADFVVTLVPAPALSLNAVGGKSYATLYLPYDVKTDGQTKAYYVASVAGGSARLVELTGGEIARYTAAILVSDNAATSTPLVAASGLTQQVSKADNLLKGTLVSRPIDLGDATPYFSMGRKDGQIGFYKFQSGGNTTITLGANKAYLDTSAATGESSGAVKGFVFSFDDLPTGIEVHALPPISPSTSGLKSYDLSGRRVSNPTKGIYIVGRRKVVVK
ncbi:MAG: exo-alpha-sialidase [Bacteroidaceae bacterium]|nr:exo-alpha-sialidase [Bacteroidaceae bacterium]